MFDPFIASRAVHFASSTFSTESDHRFRVGGGAVGELFDLGPVVPHEARGSI